MSASPASLYITFTVINIWVLISTLFRLFFRLHIRRFWWEDAWAAVAFVSGTVFVITQYIYSVETGFDAMIISCWISPVFSTITMCAVRMSILYSIIRVMSPQSRIRTFARIVAIFLLIFCATSVALRYYLCTNPIIPPEGTQVTQPATRKCIDGGVFTVFQLTTDCISDAILVILPLKLLWRVELPRRQRRMILALFSSCAVVSIFSLVHGIFPDNSVEFSLTLNLETTSALIVCNLLVLVTYVYRVFHKLRGESVDPEWDDSSADDDFTSRTPARGTTEALTIVDLDIPASYSGVNSDASCSSSLAQVRSSHM